MPLNIHATGTAGASIHTVNIVSIPHGEYLDKETMGRLQQPPLLEHEPQQLEPAPLIEHQDVFVPETETQRQLLAKLEALSEEQLREIAKQVGCDVDIN